MSKQDSLGEQLSEILRRLESLEKRGMRIPTVDQDPIEEDPAGLWAFNDDRIRRRRQDGSVAQYLPDSSLLDYVDAAVSYRVIPTVSSTPMAGINAWILASNGNLQVRLPSGAILSYAPTVPGAVLAGGSNPTRPGSLPISGVPLLVEPTSEKTYDEIIAADWAATYDGSGVYRETGAELHYGQAVGSEASFGSQKVMVSFQSAATMLAGAQIEDVEIISEVLSTQGTSGSSLYFGTHSATSQPASYENRSVNNFRVLTDTGHSLRARISTTFGEQLRDGVITGFVIDQPSDSQAYHGSISRDVYLRLVYVK